MTFEQGLKLRALEEDIRHYRELQRLQGERLDAHQQSLDVLAGMAKDVSTMTGHLGAVSSKLDRLIEVLLRDHPNGGAK